MPVKRKELKATYQQHGVWEEYLKLRDVLKKEGRSPAEATKEAQGKIDALISQRQRQLTKKPKAPAPEPTPPADLHDHPYMQLLGTLIWIEHSLEAGAPLDPIPSSQAMDLLLWVQESEEHEAAFRHAVHVWKTMPTEDSDLELDLLLEHGQASFDFLQKCFALMGIEGNAVPA